MNQEPSFAEFLEGLRGRLAGAARTISRELAPRRAAVAALLAQRPEPALLLIRRAEHPDDPWSGQMGLPGGRLNPQEEPLQAAVRETREEVGIDLEQRAALLGPLDELQAIGRGRVLPLAIHPFVFACAAQPPARHDPREVAETLWVPLSFLADRDNLDSMRWRELQLPCYHYQGRRIWGLTFRMIQSLLARIRHHSPVAPPPPLLPPPRALG